MVALIRYERISPHEMELINTTVRLAAMTMMLVLLLLLNWLYLRNRELSRDRMHRLSDVVVAVATTVALLILAARL